MKMLRCLLLITMVSALSGIAKADNLDFHLVVVDPSYSVDAITSTPDSVTFTNCVTGQVPSTALGTYVGCATFQNETGSALTNLQLTFPNTSALGGQSANCSLDGGVVSGTSTPLDYFQTASCSLSNNVYTLDFSNGSIPVNSYFTIAENGVTPADFPTMTLTTTPEPGSVWLLSTGALMLSVFFYYKRRDNFGDQRL